jgi:hypothetical protein
MNTDDPYADRKQMTFEQAEGVEPMPSQLKLGELSDQLRSALWAAVHHSLRLSRRTRDYAKPVLGTPWSEILHDMFVYRSHRMTDEFSSRFDAIVAEVKKIFAEGNYIEVFGWLQWVLRRRDCPAGFAESIEYALEVGHAPYRIIDRKTIVPIGSKQEHETIKRAFVDLSATEFGGARAHLSEAAAELTQGNCSASIRESIHSVESVARMLEPSGEFSKALAKLESKIAIHSALKSGFGSIYGFTSDEKGIRHPLLDKPVAAVDEADALFMLGACAAFVSYLINKARMANLMPKRQ